MQACVQKAMQGMLNFCCFELTILTEFSMSEKVCIWSDGGPKHFKNSHALFAAAQIAFKEGVCIWNSTLSNINFRSSCSGAFLHLTMDTAVLMEVLHMASEPLVNSLEIFNHLLVLEKRLLLSSTPSTITLLRWCTSLLTVHTSRLWL